MIRVAVADDEARLRAHLREIVDAQPDFEVVGEAADGLEAVRLAQEGRPDIVMISMHMPRMNGVDAARLITSIADAPRVVMLTTADLDADLYQALLAGAGAYLPMDTAAGPLTEALRTVAYRRRPPQCRGDAAPDRRVRPGTGRSEARSGGP